MCKDVGLPSIVGDDPELMVVPDEQSSVKQVAEPELNNDAPSASWNWNEEDIDAPTSEFKNIPIPNIYFEFEFVNSSISVYILNSCLDTIV